MCGCVWVAKWETKLETKWELHSYTKTIALWSTCKGVFGLPNGKPNGNYILIQKLLLCAPHVRVCLCCQMVNQMGITFLYQNYSSALHMSGCICVAKWQTK